jgi:hypothetical protein
MLCRPGYNKNSSFDLKTLAKDKFHVSSHNNKERFETLDNVLIHNGLYTMVMKTRCVPTVTTLNPYGQSADIISVVDNVVTIIKADNVRLWCDDMNQLMQILLAAFDRTLHHHSKGFLAKDGIQAYNNLRDFYYRTIKERRRQGTPWRLSRSSHHPTPSA